MIQLLHGDCREVLKTLPECSVDAIVTDPPYELGFMGRDWDRTGVANDSETWRQALRVLKPGGHLLAFGGTRTFHRMAVAIEDAGFELRDGVGYAHEAREVTFSIEECPWLMAWVYGSGFPKSLNVSKAIDSGSGRPEDIRRMQMGEDYRPSGRGRVNYDHGAASAMDAGPSKFDPATDAARQWQGWGTALKPAWEPIVMARKPLAGTVAANVLAHGTGALNIDGCRVGTEDMSGQWDRTWNDNSGEFGERYPQSGREAGKTVPPGRWPANLIHDGSDEVVGLFPVTKSGAVNAGHKQGTGSFGTIGGETILRDYGGDKGSAARFFYCAKADREDRNAGLGRSDAPAVREHATMGDRERADWAKRNGNHHPTVKPTELMRYLVRLVTPPGGVVLDPFMGSGSTLKAAELEGFSAIGIEREAEYLEIARRRIAADAPLFAEAAT